MWKTPDGDRENLGYIAGAIVDFQPPAEGDILIGRADEFDEMIVRKFIDKNRLRWKDLITIFARLVMSRSWIGDFHGETGFTKLDTVIKRTLKEMHEERYAEMTFVEKYLGYGLRPVTREEVMEIKKELREKQLSNELKGGEN